MLCEPRNHIQREVRSLELRVGVHHHGNVDRIGNGAEIGFDLPVLERKIGFQDRKDAVGAEFDRSLLPGGLAEIAGEFAALAPGTSSDVLLLRPDVEQAEHLLEAANADIGVARAELFPHISLTGLLGLASNALGSLFTGGAFTATAGADAAYTIFDAGGRRANVAVSEAQRDAALATYEKAIQTAFREVSDVLAVRGTIGDRLTAARANTAAAADTARLTEARYREGIDSFLASLDAQRSLYTARRQEAAVTAASLENLVELYRALGADRFAAGGA